MKKFLKYKSMSLKQKIIFLFLIVFVFFSLGVSLSSIIIFSRVYKNKSNQYIGDITRQTTNNMENNIGVLEELTFNILKNTTVQSQLELVNTKNLSVYERINLSKSIENELIRVSLFNENIVSLTVLSLDDMEFTVQKVHGKKIKKMFSEEEIYKAGGTTLWAVTDDGENNINIARAIISLRTQKPIGYINIICDESYFKDIVKDISGSYYSGTYVVDRNNIVVSSNNKRYVTKRFPLDLKNIQGLLVSEIDSVKSYIYIGEKINNGWSLVTVVPTNEVFKDVKQFALISVIISLGAIFISVIIIFIFIHKVTKPIQQLSESMSAVGEGDFSVRVPVSTDDEIGKLSKTYNRMAENIETLIEAVYEMEISQKQAEIEYLKMQINPHFLYNTLETISWMARIGGNEEVSEMTIALSDLLRSTIKQDSFVTIEEELKSVHNYLLIQEYRFGDKIQVSYEIDEKAKDYIIPNFILQPLIENSIIHGIEPKLEKGHLLIKIKVNDQRLNFIIKDDGVGMTADEVKELYIKCEVDKDNKNLIGIKNVYRRLKIYYGKEGALKIESDRNRGTVISFSIPLEKIAKNKRGGSLHGNE